MNLFKQAYQNEKDDDSNALGFKSLRKNLRRLPQKGTTNISRDEVRKALASGKRVSASGKVYWETRKNRSDSPNSNV